MSCMCVCQMSTGQKYRRTEFEDNDENNSPAGDANSPGVVYNPVIAFQAASFSGSRTGGLIGRGSCARRSGLEKLLMVVVAVLSVIVVVLMVMLGARSGQSDVQSSSQAVTSRLQAESRGQATSRGHGMSVSIADAVTTTTTTTTTTATTTTTTITPSPK